MTKRKDVWFILLFAVVVVTAALVWLAPWQGERAPDVRVETLDGERFTLEELRGKPVIVAFWATTCSECVSEIPHFKALYEEYSDQGLELIAVAMEYDPESQVRAMVEDRDIPYTVALDRDGSIARAFGDVRLTPTTFLVSPDGKILSQRLGMVDMDRMRERITGLLPADQVASLDTPDA
ncbi:peroxiredoxin family protein [Aquisalimonas asiatica]|uniref:Peroxiredoxin n=1 Tax=Aquisalimonas asiatica TaxID=406100 RepID=A0A1H8U0B8_9GAMM|nr:TlpA disulfide reductase family protein [Aquisalimonas asiatica]SEO96098.1 Peroxiredoxin [Aquisalimonas asiatica]